MKIDFDSEGNLPPGVYDVTWAELVAHCDRNPHRRRLLSGLRRALEVLKAAGCRRVYLDGSFVTNKEAPSDFDACWERAGMDLRKLYAADPVLLMFSNGRAAQKAKYFGEMFPADSNEGNSGLTFLRFFQRDKDSGQAKGILSLDLGGL